MRLFLGKKCNPKLLITLIAQPSSDILLRFDETEKLTFMTTRKDDTTDLILLNDNGSYVFYELSLKNMSVSS